ncbi:Triacylglycerol lipase-like protein triacylglycerol lipase [Heterostelium album PN500]|uniref:Triacylglycerol lipase-like protein triacylglycerol lipase n=1 Tax=Heterostelium pallidum (strain ATCC 26659 / Pp 5 / PN500) TaxID=670386 RepID=D3BUM1_HETP5|nr:Triacylglycerol lipase-like protein triacylglycerol lipase [Heterostelium album PN500]EFA74809.1 Triacylglycerol lipase-like protein triacylglycerol lipase [Heterostelium album PN500]|eukprot:XP_020426943.1 Triacylglycerol lipase-like protein triacylglycerol lipase [Heterostelium album PN500]
MKLSIIFILLLQLLSVTINVAHSDTPPSDIYSASKSFDFLLLSYASYCPANEIAAWNCSRCISQVYPAITDIQVIYAVTTDTQAFVGVYNNQVDNHPILILSEKNKLVFVAFRGSMDIASWITNLKFLQTPYPKAKGAMVHIGFYQAWLSVQPQVEAALTSALKSCPTCTSIVVTGHSLGAAISTLCMADVIELFPNVPTELINFGSPRVGNSAFSNYFNSIQPNTWRVTNQKDLVPHVPPQVGIEFYEHVTNELWYFNSTINYEVCQSIGEDPYCSDSVNPLEYSIYDHLHYYGEDMTAEKIVIGIWGTALLTSPFWGMPVLLATCMMNDANQGKRMERAQLGCLVSLFSAPIVLSISLYKTYYNGYSHTFAFLPLLPLASYISLLFIGFSKKKQ